MTYREQPFNQRLNAMGDQAEGIFESISPMGKWARFGWNRPNIPMAKMSSELRHTPDYYTANGYLVEVGGLGRDGTYKLKVDKYHALAFWNEIQPLKLFVWNSALSEWALLPFDDVTVLIDKAEEVNGIQSFSNDGNEYYPIEWEWVPGRLPYE